MSWRQASGVRRQQAPAAVDWTALLGLACVRQGTLIGGQSLDPSKRSTGEGRGAVLGSRNRADSAAPDLSVRQPELSHHARRSRGRLGKEMTGLPGWRTA